MAGKAELYVQVNNLRYEYLTLHDKVTFDLSWLAFYEAVKTIYCMDPTSTTIITYNNYYVHQAII